MAGVLMVASMLVVLAFDPTPHIGGDNSGYVALAHGLVAEGVYVDTFDPEGLPHTKYPPVFPAILAVLIGLGAQSWAVLKLPAALATVLSVGLTFAWARPTLGALPAAAVALLVATSAGFTYYSHWILSDPLFVLFTLSSLLCLRRAEAPDAENRWLVGGVAAAGLAYFTRSAGLPLLVALLLWLAMRRRWRAVVGSVIALGLPMVFWLLRSRGEGVAQYGTEFWLVNPYDPAEGRVGLLGLMLRVLRNAVVYAFSHGPMGLVGLEFPWLLVPLGIVLTVAGVGGWWLTARSTPGPAELFVPMYVGLIILWPEQWGGDRFLLPLLPLALVYATVALRALLRALPAATARPVYAAAFLVLILPAGLEWAAYVRSASTCRWMSRSTGVWACHTPGIGAFADAAIWAGDALPEDAVVISRKPRHFYVFSGLKSRTFPFSEDSEEHLALADEVGARYVLLDRWDVLARRYLGQAMGRRLSAYCFLGDFGRSAEARAQLFRILPPGERPAANASADTLPETVTVPRCEDAPMTPAGAGERYPASLVPLLARPAS